MLVLKNFALDKREKASMASVIEGKNSNEEIVPRLEENTILLEEEGNTIQIYFKRKYLLLLYALEIEMIQYILS